MAESTDITPPRVARVIIINMHHYRAVVDYDVHFTKVDLQLPHGPGGNPACLQGGSEKAGVCQDVESNVKDHFTVIDVARILGLSAGVDPDIMQRSDRICWMEC